jgi:hypothetical protein
MADDLPPSIPEDLEDRLTEEFAKELAENRPESDEKLALLEDHRHHLIRLTTSQFTETEQPQQGIEIDKQAEVLDAYCFTCEAWVGFSGVDLTGTPRSKKEAFYYGGPPDGVLDARNVVREALAVLVKQVAETVPEVNDVETALEFIGTEHEKAVERVEAADDKD